MHSKPRLTAVVSRACFILSCVVYAALLIINETVYSGIISMLPIQALFVLSISLCVLLKEPRKNGNMNILPAAAVIIAVVEISAFSLNLPAYSASEAADVIRNSSKNVSVSQNSSYPVMDTIDPLSSAVSKGYVFNCTNSDTNKQTTVFFDPISGEYFDIE